LIALDWASEPNLAQFGFISGNDTQKVDYIQVDPLMKQTLTLLDFSLKMNDMGVLRTVSLLKPGNDGSFFNLTLCPRLETRGQEVAGRRSVALCC